MPTTKDDDLMKFDKKIIGNSFFWNKSSLLRLVFK